jgi:hypothetical protein
MLIYWVKTYVLHRKTEALIFTSREVGLDVNAEKPEYVFCVSQAGCGTKSEHKDE